MPSHLLGSHALPVHTGVLALLPAHLAGRGPGVVLVGARLRGRAGEAPLITILRLILIVSATFCLWLRLAAARRTVSVGVASPVPEQLAVGRLRVALAPALAARPRAVTTPSPISACPTPFPGNNNISDEDA